MSTTIRNALEFYWLRKENRLPARMTVQQYYEGLREYVYEELKDTGACSLMDHLLCTGSMEWDVPTCDAAIDALRAVQMGVEMEGPREYKLLPANGSALIYRMEPQQIESIRSHYQQYVDSWRSAPRPWGVDLRTSSQYKNDRQLAKAKAEAEKLREQARTEAERIRRDARAEAEKILENARAEAARFLANAASEKSQADMVVAAAQEELLDARQQAERIREEARAEAERIRRELLENAQEEARAEAEQMLQRMVGDQLNDYLAQQRRQWEAEQPRILEAREHMAQQTALLKEQACSFSNNASVDLMQVMEETMEQLRTVKSTFSTQLQQWKSDMYRCEYSAIIGCFNSLMVLERRFERDVAAEADMTAEEQLTKLQQHSVSLTGLRNRMERALNTMGLSLFMPQPGERFDACYHTLDGDEEDEQYTDRQIAACTSPGIMRKVNSEEDVVMQRAVVTLQPEEEAPSKAAFPPIHLF